MQTTSADNHSSTADVNPHSHMYVYDLDEMDDTKISTLRSIVAQIRTDFKNTNMVSGSLFMICNLWIHLVTMSELAYDVMSNVQRSWVVERKEAVGRHARRTGTDHESLVDLLLDTNRNYQRGIPVPNHL